MERETLCPETSIVVSNRKSLRVVIHAMHPRKVFRISRGARAEVENIFVRLSGEGVSGFGEASPNPFYAESARDVRERIEAAGPLVADLQIDCVADIELAWPQIWDWVAPSRAAQCALDLALWDWLARRNHQSVAQLALDEAPRPVPSFCTIGLSDSTELEEKITELRGFPLIKIKSDGRADLAPIAMVRERTGATVAVDANCAWRSMDVVALSRDLAKMGVLFIEQPLHPADDARMAELAAASALPIVADESCVVSEDVEELPGRFSGFNLKLVKCGGLTPALAMVRRGRELGLRTMVGCMLESSLLIAAGAVVAQQTDYADLDGAWLLRDDPFQGLPLQTGVLTPSNSPGFGVEPTGRGESSVLNP